MDRNTVVGLVLIGVILSVFTIFTQPDKEELNKRRQETEMQKKKKDSKESTTSNKDTNEETKDQAEEKPVLAPTMLPKLDSQGKPVTTDKGLVYIDTLTKKEVVIPSKKMQATETSSTAKGDTVTLQNDKLKIIFSTKGGKVAGVYLKEYKSYTDYANGDTVKYLRLFEDGDAVNQLIIPVDGQTIRTGAYLFDISKQTDNSISFTLDLGEGRKVTQTYTLKDNEYDLTYKVNVKGFEGSVNPKNVLLNWDVAYRKTERLFSEQRRVSTICMKYENEGFDYLSEMADDDAAAEDNVDWISFKQSYFSSFLKPDKGFSKEGSKFKIRNYGEGHDREWSHLKLFSTTVNLGLDDVNDGTVSMNWFFGPNDYELLRSYKSGYDDILNFGWGLFRWINLYAVQPLFNLLANTGMGIGIAILLLTLILKIVLMPVQWKMYVSSAKMRILKPEVDELNAKYPNKDDAMKKQMEMMTLYRESGASPLAGCVPMLIQMPILLAVFRFFPSAFELRQKSFLWAEDLSSYDSIWNFGVYIWPYGDHVSLFTLLMAGTTLIYTVMNSGNMQQPQQPGMPNMKIIMYIFPFMMIFFFNNYSSGLSYYYFISTLISILIMVLIKQVFVDEEKLKLKMAARKADSNSTGTKEKKKSKFQERLEQMQKAQQEQIKNRKK